MNAPASRPRLLNLGCGHRFHPDWVNVDIAPRDPSVIRCDLQRGIPFPDQAFDAVYHSNVLEHIRRQHALSFMQECRRVLRPGGILRVAVPDLEQICRLYLDTLDRAAANQPGAADEYDWLLLELLDQTVRERAGGGMAEYLSREPVPAEAFVLRRIGTEGRELLEALRAEARQGPKRRKRRWRLSRQALRRWVISLLFGRRAGEALELGRFRLGGEIHQWMYDRFSLARLMKAAGFVAPEVMTPGTSRIPDWAGYHLEAAPDGTVHKPDSFVTECMRPE